MQQLADSQTALGRYFLLHFACELHHEPVLQIYTYLAQEIRVSIFIPKDDSQEDAQHMTVQKSLVSEYQIPLEYLNWQIETYQKPFKLSAKYLFGVTVLMYAQVSSGSFMLIPLQNFGTSYYAVTLDYDNVVSNGTYLLNFLLVMSGLDEVRLTVNVVGQDINITYCNKDKVLEYCEAIVVDMPRLVVFTLMECSPTVVNGSKLLSGTHIKATDVVGVISGSCRGSRSDAGVLSCDENAIGMLLPEPSYGEEFVVFQSQAIIKLLVDPINTIANTNSCQLVDSDNPEQRNEFILDMSPAQQHCILTTDKPASVYLVYYRKECGGLEYLDFLSLLPTSVYFQRYVWRALKLSDAGSKITLFVICRDQDREQLLVDDKQLEYVWQDIAGSSLWKLGVTEITEGFHMANHTSEFGAYIIYTSDSTTTLNILGYNLVYMSCEDTVHLMLPGDLVDNDCDGTVDEEILNNQDDDKDTKIDEDLAMSESTDQQECPPMTFGPNCSISCANCKNCDKETGTCSQCSSGFQLEQNHCDKECPDMTFGENCSGNCYSKCGEDCLDRIYGSCSRLSISNLQDLPAKNEVKNIRLDTLNKSDVPLLA
ncbi:uncharacterized protein LOC106079764 isoform X2 [Biomphalaria glabrata]|uniref:Uncharacterized protein LOC106079764 isoform X2 n=1 Tax=Biomphalaria glabrata TaxID=6526 RepID=A0A9W2ZC76_BIOGL|nr:uncharacterized protein LOC106079764 isoform X2 [Biomphalaria glabrata]